MTDLGPRAGWARSLDATGPISAAGPQPRRAAEDAYGPASVRRARRTASGGAPHPDAARFARQLAVAVDDRRRPEVDESRSATRQRVTRNAVGRESATGESGPERSGTGLDVGSLSLPDSPALLCDLDERIVRVNPALLRLLGVQSEDPDAAAGIVGQRLRRVLVESGSGSELIRPDGGRVRVRAVRWDLPGAESAPPEFRAVLLVDIDDLPIGARSRDADRIGDRRRLVELQRMTGVGTWSYDLTTGRQHRGAALTELYDEVGIGIDPATGSWSVELEQIGYLRDALLAEATRVADDGAGDGAGPGEAVDLPAEMDGPTHHVEYRTAAPLERVLSCRAHVERAPDGRPLRLVGLVRDVTAQRVAELRVRRSRQRFADLVALTPAGVALFDQAGTLVEANATLCSLLGCSLAELRGRCAVSFSAEGVDWLRQACTGAERSYQPTQLAVHRADGMTVWCELAVSASVGDDGRPFWLVVFTDLSARRAAPGELPIASLTDELTQLPNRLAAKQTLQRLLGDGEHRQVAVLCCDIDDFKRVNDSLGHEAGDQLLVAIATRLQDELPGGCSATRLSGDEFAVVCADTAEHGGLEALADTIAGLFRTTVVLHGQSVRLSASLGVAAAWAGSLITPADLIRFADAAMHEVKRGGGGRIGFATDVIMTAASQQLAMEAELRAAIASDELVLHYQPVVDVGGAVRSAEALIRWPHPQRGWLSPGEFIPVAERGGLMRELDCWVLRTATKQAARWPLHDGRPVCVAVNLAGLLPGDAGFAATVSAALAESGLPSERLVLELVETGLVELSAAGLAAMTELTARGVRFAVDDFGTGYSSLSRLKELPTEIVKVDRSFVAGVSSDPADYALARAVVDIARAMGRSCVAEGVETAEQFEALRGIGVDAFQGWLFAKPVAGPALCDLLEGDRLPTPGSIQPLAS